MPDKRVATLCAVVIVAAGAAFWWLQRGEDQNVGMPQKVCNKTFSGPKVEPLFPTVNGALDSEVDKQFPGSARPTDMASGPLQCALYIDGYAVSFRVSTSSYAHSPERTRKENEYVAELGSVYGYFHPPTGALTTITDCPSRDEKANKLIVTTRAETAEQEDASHPSRKEQKAMGRISKLSSYTTRHIAQDSYNCKDADRIPNGRVQIKPGGKLR